MNLNLLPKNLIVSSVVNTLKDDPEQGVIKLLEMAQGYVKSSEQHQMLDEISRYYQMSSPAKMQIKNLVHNTTRKTLAGFVGSIIDALSKTPLTIYSLRWTSIAKAESFKHQTSYFPLIDLKNLNEPSQEVLQTLKQAGAIYFVTIDVRDENAHIVTGNDVILTLIKLGVRGIFYRMATPDPSLENHLKNKIHQIRKTLPILAFYMKKDSPGGKSNVYEVTETIQGQTYSVQLKL